MKSIATLGVCTLLSTRCLGAEHRDLRGQLLDNMHATPATAFNKDGYQSYDVYIHKMGEIDDNDEAQSFNRLKALEQQKHASSQQGAKSAPVASTTSQKASNGKQKVQPTPASAIASVHKLSPKQEKIQQREKEMKKREAVSAMQSFLHAQTDAPTKLKRSDHEIDSKTHKSYNFSRNAHVQFLFVFTVCFVVIVASLVLTFIVWLIAKVNRVIALRDEQITRIAELQAMQEGKQDKYSSRGSYASNIQMQDLNDHIILDDEDPAAVKTKKKDFKTQEKKKYTQFDDELIITEDESNFRKTPNTILDEEEEEEEEE